MENNELNILILTFISHFMGDFILQPSNWAKMKDEMGFKSRQLYIHVVIHSSLLTVLLADITLIKYVIIQSLSHLAIDGLKVVFKFKKSYVFVIDQIIHMVLLILIWMLYFGKSYYVCQIFKEQISNTSNLIILLTTIILTNPASILIGKITGNWRTNIEKSGSDDKYLTGENSYQGLLNAGKWIGIIERLMIFIFILTGNLTSIGFLLAAKSVFRFGDLRDKKDYKKTEYIIIGTLISFFIAISLGFISIKLLNLFN